MVIDRKTFYAVAELVQAAAHQHGLVGPVQFHVYPPRDYSWCGVKDGTRTLSSADQPRRGGMSLAQGKTLGTGPNKNHGAPIGATPPEVPNA